MSEPNFEIFKGNYTILSKADAADRYGLPRKESFRQIVDDGTLVERKVNKTNLLDLLCWTGYDWLYIGTRKN